jgi:N,N'-diacetyllegionaminate synthase
MELKIKNKKIGKNNPTFVIAEGGINHNGSVKIAKKLILKAAEIGSDAIKFQTFTASDLTSTKSKYYKIFKKLELNESQFGEISDFAKNHNIIFLSTPFSENAVDILDKLKVPVFKIASGDLTHIPLIKYASSKNKPMIISSGMGTIEEVNDAVKTIKSQKNNKIAIMHSVSAYPTPHNESNLKAILTLQNNFEVPIGYSDNGNNLLIPLIAVSIGAKIIEKHFTLSKKMKGPDHELSANPKEFKEMISKIKIIEESLGDGKKQCQQSEFENMIQSRRSITTNIKIPKNIKIEQSMISIKRPATGIEPKFINSVIGKITKKAIGKDESVEWKNIK